MTNQLSATLASSLVMSSLAGAPYSDLGYWPSAGKPIRGTWSSCCKCGKTSGTRGVTLYKFGNDRICRECRKELKNGNR